MLNSLNKNNLKLARRIKIFKSLRISISEFKDSDINTSYIGWLNNPNHMKFSNQRFKKHSKKTASDYVQTFSNTPNKFFSIKTNSTLIGTLTLYFESNGIANAGILIGPEYSGQGFGTETWKLLIEEIAPELQVKKLLAGALSVNRAMLNVFEKSGMQFYQLLKNAEVFDDTLCDVIVYSAEI
jgi:RimJ/RimL family protein N-acetyltransferase